MPMLLRAFGLLVFAAVLSSWSMPFQSEAPPQKDADLGDVYQAGRGADAPQMLTRTEPNYSSTATVPGTVVMTMVIDKTGIPRKVQVKKHLTDSEDSAAVEAVKQWRFRPGMRGGNPVAVKATVAVTFHKLDDKQ